MSPTTLSYEEMIQRAINALKQADASYSFTGHRQSEDETRLCFAAARTWLNRAEYSMRQNGRLKSSDNETADRAMFTELLGDYAKDEARIEWLNKNRGCVRGTDFPLWSLNGEREDRRGNDEHIREAIDRAMNTTTRQG